MRLTFEKLRSALRGVAAVTEEAGNLSLHRFTAAQEELYRIENGGYFSSRTFATAGVVLEFDTNSETLCLSVEVTPASSECHFVHSIFADGKRIGELSGAVLPEQKNIPFHGTFALGKGQKRVKVAFPWSAASQICGVELDDGALFCPVTKEKTILLYGDSITQGYFAAQPENTYASLITEFLDANGICKGVGGETFRPALADLADPVTPELITVAYGTNDWSGSKAELFLENSLAFLQRLRSTYPNAPIFLLAPIWRADMHMKTDVGDFRSVAAHYRHLAEIVPGVTTIDCFDFVPHDPAFYQDLRLHPNDIGFRHYANELIEKLHV